MLSFDEFRAVNNRERNKEAVKEQDLKAKVPKPKRKVKITDENDTSPSLESKPQQALRKSFFENIGEFLELHSMQLFYILLLIADTFSAFLELYLQNVALSSGSVAPVTASSYVLYIKSLKSFSKFTSMIFSLEIFLVYLSFGLPSLFHFGYLTDLIILSTQMYLESKGYGSEIRLLNFVRLWRPLRLLNAIVAQEKEKQVILQKRIDVLEEETKRLSLNIDSIKLEVTKEKEAKIAVENMLINYKEEVDTLNEALKIAAMDIAEVGQNEDEFLTSEDEGLGGGSDNDENMTGSVGSRSKNESGSVSTAERSKRSSKLGILRTALEGNPLPPSVVMNESKSTFVVHEDGKFEKK
jgi:methyl coenzyme M reductase subunit D